MLTVSALINQTRIFNPASLKNAQKVSVKFKKAQALEDDDGDKYYLIQAICHGETVARNVTLKLYGKGKDPKVWASCDCEWFKYACEYPTFRKGSTDLLYANGPGKKIRNPSQTPALCKHLSAALLRGALDLREG